MSTPPAAKPTLLVLLALVCGAPASAAPGYTLRTIALEGSSAPGTADSFGAFLDVSINASGSVAFGAPLASGFPNAGVWMDPGSGPVLRLRNGDAAPAPLSGSYQAFGGFARLDGSGRVATAAILTGGIDGLFLDTGGSDSALVYEGGAAPTPPGGTFAASIGTIGFFGMNGSGDVSFHSDVSGGSSASGLFVRSSGGSTSLVVGSGDAVGGGPETFTSFDSPAINGSGDLAYSAATSGGPASPALFRDTGSGAVPLARAGDPAPDTGGGTLADFLYPAIGANGDVAFLSNVTGGSASGGLFLASPALSSVVVEGQSVPGAGPVSTMASLPALAADGSLAVSLGFASGPVAGGVYRVAPAGAFEPVALSGETPPGVGGATFASFGFLGLNDSGQIAFVATLDDQRTGIFLATPETAPVPMLPPAALPVLSALLVGTAIAARRATA